jgi:hypothetical protein
MKLFDVLLGKAPSYANRSSKWPAVRKAFLKQNPFCLVCGGTSKLEAHHIVPFHLAPELELVESNLVALCESKKHGVNCHLFFGHLGDYSKINSDVKIDTWLWSNKLKEIS